MMRTATAQEFQALLGDIDPLAIERILDTHATIDEVAEALADVEHERSMGERRMPSSTRVAAVREILEEVLDEDIEDDRGMGFGSTL
jgi:hypothetical protein